MELSFNDLKKRDVVNVVDGKCYGRITDLTLSFPKGVLTGITVPGSKKNCITRLFDKSRIFIEESRILKIGNDVILVNLKCGEVCAPSIDGKRPKNPPPYQPSSPQFPDCEELFGEGEKGRIDMDDY